MFPGGSDEATLAGEGVARAELHREVLEGMLDLTDRQCDRREIQTILRTRSMRASIRRGLALGTRFGVTPESRERTGIGDGSMKTRTSHWPRPSA